MHACRQGVEAHAIAAEHIGLSELETSGLLWATLAGSSASLRNR